MRLFSLRLFCFSRNGCRSALGCTSKRSWCLVLLSCRTSLMHGMPRSLLCVGFDTYRGASAVDRSVLGWHLCRMAILKLLAQPHSSMPYVHMGFIATLYTRTLFSRDNGDFLPKSQYSCLNFRSICFVFLAMCSLQFNFLSIKWCMKTVTFTRPPPVYRFRRLKEFLIFLCVERPEIYIFLIILIYCFRRRVRQMSSVLV